MQEALDSILRPQTLQYREDLAKAVDGAKDHSDTVAGDKGSSRSSREYIQDEYHARSRSQVQCTTGNTRLTLGFKGGEVSSMDDLLAELQLIGREDKAGWVVLERMTNKEGRDSYCSDESTVTLVGEAQEVHTDATEASQQADNCEFHSINAERGQRVDPTWRHAWYVSTPGWPRFKHADNAKPSPSDAR
ncbi:hypothetical protein DAEQUDRAFT_723160 [Daedalea quercina L-15889]|uniref:Uncharacterized protein n=1 Tax=Daedalea quercina L-15889 TaxID=1314783 RepID=A0A165SSX2_9APHY|nr:hypothetical protein DAEQUDRAFT_723160 [Daedalea quercina L-15889]